MISTHHYGVDLAADKAGDGAVEDADTQRHGGGDKSHHQRHAATVHHPGQQVAAKDVGAEPVLPAGAGGAQGQVLLLVTVGGDPGGEDGYHNKEHQHREARHGQVIFAQPHPGIRPQGGAFFRVQIFSENGVVHVQPPCTW